MNSNDQLNRALRYIEEHLTDALNLEDIAEAANYSAWHFHRLFQASTGISVGEYIRKRRFSEACWQLLHTRKPIKQIASDYCFESQAAFTRSFKKICGCTPGKLRAELGKQFRFDSLVKTHSRGYKMQEPKIVHKEAFRLFGLNCRTTMNNNVIPAHWEKFNGICHTIPGVVRPQVAYGVCYMDPEEPMGPDAYFFYMSALEVDNTTPLPEGLEEKHLPENDYAVFEHHGSLDNLQETYNQIYSEWMPDAQWERASEYDFEYYDHRFKYGAPDSVLEIWIPVKKKDS